jgi:hypothetical protein
VCAYFFFVRVSGEKKRLHKLLLDPTNLWLKRQVIPYNYPLFTDLYTSINYLNFD